MLCNVKKKKKSECAQNVVGSPKRQWPFLVILTLAVVVGGGGGLQPTLPWGGGGGLQPTLPWGGGLQLTVAWEGESSTNFTFWGGGRGGQRYPSCIAARCYQCAHLWSKGWTEGLHLLIYLCCNASWGHPPPVDRRTETLKTLPSQNFVCGR